MIKLIVFDFGGVYFTDNVLELAQKLSKEIGVQIEEFVKVLKTILPDYEKGRISEQEFWDKGLKMLNKSCNIQKLHDIAIEHFKPIKETAYLIEKLKKNYKIGMLSNQTNWADELNFKYNFFHHFDPLIISKNVGFKKPEQRIYEILIEKAKCKPEEIVFIDDSESHGDVPKKLGINFIHYKSSEQLEEKLKELGLKF